MNDDRGRRALPRGLFELIGPTAIIGHGAAVERPAQARALIIRIVDQNDDRLASDIHPGIVVPLLFRRLDAIADEDDRAILDLDMRRSRAVGGDYHLRSIIGRNRPLAANETQRRNIFRRDLDQRDILEPASLVARLQPDRLEPSHQIGKRLLLPRSPRRPPFIGVR